MADETPAEKAAEETPKRRMAIQGMDEVPAMFADVFLLASDVEQGITTINFFQRQLSINYMDEGTGEMQTNTSRCVARIILSQKGTSKLLRALAEHQGFTLTPKEA